MRWLSDLGLHFFFSFFFLFYFFFYFFFFFAVGLSKGFQFANDLFFKDGGWALFLVEGEDTFLEL